MVLNRAARREAAARLSTLKRQVSLQVFTLRYEDFTCRETRQAAEELAETTSRLSVEVCDAFESGDLLRKYRVDAQPALVVTAKDAPELRFYGIPTGYVLVPLLDVIVSLGGSPILKTELISAFDSCSSGLSSVWLDLVVSRRDHASVESFAALWRVVFAAHSADTAPNPVASIRIVEDFPHWAVRSGRDPLPALLVDGIPSLFWPFTDSDIVDFIAGKWRSPDA